MSQVSKVIPFRDRKGSSPNTLNGKVPPPRRARTEAQHEAELLRSEVRSEADQLRTEARGEAERVLDERQRSSQNLTRELEGLVRRRNEFAKTFRALLERHLAEVKGEEEEEKETEKGERKRLAEPAKQPAATTQATTGGAAADASVAQPPDSGNDNGAADAWLSSILGDTEPEKRR